MRKAEGDPPCDWLDLVYEATCMSSSSFVWCACSYGLIILVLTFTIPEGQLKLFIAQDNSSGEIFIQPLRAIQQILERSKINSKKFT